MNFDDVRVYRIAFELEQKVYKTVQHISHDTLSGQIIRSSASISANIIEGWSRRFYPRDFSKFLRIALGSSDETQHHLKILYNRGWVLENEYQNLAKNYKNLSVRLVNFIRAIAKDSA